MGVTDKGHRYSELCTRNRRRKCLLLTLNHKHKNMFNLFATKAYKNLNGKEFKDGYQNASNAVLLDVRTAGEYASGTIKNSKNLDITSPRFVDSISKLDKGAEYYIFCRSGGRSAQACAIMAKQGLKVHNLSGGIGAWPS